MNEAFIKALLLACIFGAVLLAVDTIVGTVARSRTVGRAINLRLQMIGEGRSHGERMSMLRRTQSVLPEGLPSFLQRMGEKLESTLVAAQVTAPTGRLMAAILLAPFVIFLLVTIGMAGSGFALGFGRALMVGTFSVILGAVLPLMFLQAKATRTRKKMQEQFPVALDVFVRGLRAGHPIAAALDLLTIEMPDPIGSQFGVVVDEVTYGAELRDALQGMADRWDLEDMRMFVVSLSVQSETGGNLAEILENLSKVIRERQSMMLKVRALSSEGRMTGIMLSGLPILTFVLIFIGSPSFFLDVADDPMFVPGFVILGMMYFIGNYMIRRMVDLKV